MPPFLAPGGSQASARCRSRRTCACVVHPTRSLGYSCRVVLATCIIDADLKFRRPAESSGTLFCSWSSAHADRVPGTAPHPPASRRVRLPPGSPQAVRGIVSFRLAGGFEVIFGTASLGGAAAMWLAAILGAGLRAVAGSARKEGFRKSAAPPGALTGAPVNLCDVVSSLRILGSPRRTPGVGSARKPNRSRTESGLERGRDHPTR
jgi:hypothetical protein